MNWVFHRAPTTIKTNQRRFRKLPFVPAPAVLPKPVERSGLGKLVPSPSVVPVCSCNRNGSFGLRTFRLQASSFREFRVVRAPLTCPGGLPPWCHSRRSKILLLATTPLVFNDPTNCGTQTPIARTALPDVIAASLGLLRPILPSPALTRSLSHLLTCFGFAS
jgi:hypothetical protein